MPHKIRSLYIAVSLALAALLAPTASAQYGFFGWNISEFQPDIAQGGRANTISVHPKNKRRDHGVNFIVKHEDLRLLPH